MNYLERQEMFNYACADLQGVLNSRAKTIIDDNGIKDYDPNYLMFLFLEFIDGNLRNVPDSAFASQEALGDYLLYLFETFNWLSLPDREYRSPDILKPGDLEDSGLALDPATNQNTRLYYTGSDYDDTDDIVHLPFGKLGPIPIDVHAVQRAAESLY